MNSPRWYQLTAEAVTEQLHTSAEGLAAEECVKRLEQYGPNRLPEEKGTHPVVILLRQFASPLIYILLAIMGLYAFRRMWRAWREWRDSVYSLEREFALNRLGRATAFGFLVLLLFFAEFYITTFIVPSLPAADITVVHRADGSGTTFIFTNYLSKVSAEWRSSIGEGNKVNWKTGTGGQSGSTVIGSSSAPPLLSTTVFGVSGFVFRASPISPNCVIRAPSIRRMTSPA